MYRLTLMYLGSFIFTVNFERVLRVGSCQFIVSIYEQVFVLEYSSLFLVTKRVYMASRRRTAPAKNGTSTPLPPTPQLNMKKTPQFPTYQTKMFQVPPFTICLRFSKSPHVGGRVSVIVYITLSTFRPLQIIHEAKVKHLWILCWREGKS